MDMFSDRGIGVNDKIDDYVYGEITVDNTSAPITAGDLISIINGKAVRYPSVPDKQIVLNTSSVTNTSSLGKSAFLILDWDYQTNSGKILHAYLDQTTAYIIWGVIYKIAADGTVTTGTPFQLANNSADTSYYLGANSICKVDTDKYAIVYVRTASVGYAIMKGFTVNDTTITGVTGVFYPFGTTYASGNSSSMPSIGCVATNQVFIAGMTGATAYFYGAAGTIVWNATIANTTCTFGTAVGLGASSGYIALSKVIPIGNNKAAVISANGSNGIPAAQLCFVSISGNTTTAGAVTNYPSGYPWASDVFVNSAGTAYAFAMYNATSAYYNYMIYYGTLSGVTQTATSSVNITPAMSYLANNGAGRFAQIADDKLFLEYTTRDDGYTHYIIVENLYTVPTVSSQTTIPPFLDVNTLSNLTNDYNTRAIGMDYVSRGNPPGTVASNKIGILRYDFNALNWQLQLYNIPNFPAHNIALTGGTVGQTIRVAYSGIVPGFSGLNTGSNYGYNGSVNGRPVEIPASSAADVFMTAISPTEAIYKSVVLGGAKNVIS